MAGEREKFSQKFIKKYMKEEIEKTVEEEVQKRFIEIEKQLNKVIPVIKVKVLQPGAFISGELALIKVSCSPKQRVEIVNIADLMNARIVDVTPTSLTLQSADTAERTATLIDLLHPYGIKEICRTGTIALEKGADPTRKN